MTINQHIAIYVRVSSVSQDHRSQVPDLERWLSAFAPGQPAKWYRDKQSGKDMLRPGWQKLEAAYRAGQVSKILVWRLDRLGRTTSGLTALFDELVEKGIGLVSMRDSLDLTTPSGRLIAGVLASCAQYEREKSRENQAAGIAAAKKQGKTWGGRREGSRNKRTEEVKASVRKLAAGGEGVSAISRAVGLSRPTVMRILGEPVA